MIKQMASRQNNPKQYIGKAISLSLQFRIERTNPKWFNELDHPNRDGKSTQVLLNFFFAKNTLYQSDISHIWYYWTAFVL